MGFSFFFWEDEVEEINIQDITIEITRPSGKLLKISLSDFWIRNLPKLKSDSSPSQTRLKVLEVSHSGQAQTRAS